MMGYRWVSTGEFFGGRDHPWGRSKWLVSPREFAERLFGERVLWEPVDDPDGVPDREPDGPLPSPRTRWLSSPGLFYGPGGPCEWFERELGLNIDRTSFRDVGLPMHARTYRTFVDYHLSDFDETHECKWAHGEGGTMMEADAEAFLVAWRAIMGERGSA